MLATGLLMLVLLAGCKSIDFYQCDFTYAVEPEGKDEWCADEGEVDNFYHVDPDENDTSQWVVFEYADSVELICYRGDYTAWIPEGQEEWISSGWWCVKHEFIDSQGP